MCMADISRKVDVDNLWRLSPSRLNESIMKQKKTGFEKSAFKDADDYFAFTQKYGVIGEKAVALKKKMDKAELFILIE